ncbi:hypothetical protein MTR67_040033 [Solanum verrucosum]|uniref:Tf2-1-like SH3-like domain-containing protein n=1 Tax=Solanum verrucosum TaxID=315347 RepID=A0AAF0UJN6_SOLVR|nr:hypothetical protein MTR67_040033 [Solanum verrucosum]
MAQFEALYGRRCRYPIGWFEVGEVALIGTELVHDAMEKVRLIRERLKTTQSQQKSYANIRRRDFEFDVHDWVYLKMSPMKGVMRFGKKGKLSPRYVSPYHILRHISKVADELELPNELASVHLVFHVSMLKKCVGDPTSIVTLEGHWSKGHDSPDGSWTLPCGDYVSCYLKVSHMKGVMGFGKKGNLSPQYIGPYRIFKRIGNIASKLELLSELAAVQPVFQVSMLKKCMGDPSLILPTKNIGIKDSLSYEEIPVQILDRQVHKLRTNKVALVKVIWRSQFVEEATWEVEEDMKKRYPHLFPSEPVPDQGNNFCQ